MRIRRNFARPFVITIAACNSTPANKHVPVSAPKDASVGVRAPADASPDESRSLSKWDGRCKVETPFDCPPTGATCNPPGPTSIKCPPGVPNNSSGKASIDVYGSSCFVEPGHTPTPCPDTPEAAPPAYNWRVARKGDKCFGQRDCTADMKTCATKEVEFDCPRTDAGTKHELRDGEVLYASELSGYCTEELPETDGKARKPRWFGCPPVE